MYLVSRAGRAGVFFACLLVLANCTEQITTDPVAFQRKSNEKDVEIINSNTVAFRTMLANEDGSRKSEVKGVPCRLESNEFVTEIVTPALVEFPVVKGKPSPMLLKCTTRDYTAEITMIPGKPGTIVYGASAAGLAALLISSAVVAASDNWTHANQPIWVPLEPRN